MVNRCGTGTSDRDNAPWSAPCLKGKFPPNLGCRPMNLIYVQRHCGLSTENSESESTANSEYAAMSIEAAFFGSLGKNAEQKTSASGKRYLRLSVRVGDGDGAQWVSVLAFDPEAMGVADRLVQGARVYVEGRLELTEWTGSDGVKRRGLNVLSWHCRLPHIGRNRPKKPSQNPAPAPNERERAVDNWGRF